MVFLTRCGTVEAAVAWRNLCHFAKGVTRVAVGFSDLFHVIQFNCLYLTDFHF